MADDTYILDLWVTGAEAVSVHDDGSGSDTIRVTGVYSATIDIDLAYSLVSGRPMNAGSRYFSADNQSHQLVIYGLIENAIGSNGSEYINGNDLANLLGGDQKQTGSGLSDTLDGGGGNDTMFGGSGDDLLSGQSDADAIWGDAGNDSIAGGTGCDTVEGGAGADTLDGGGDAGDTLSYATSRRGVQVVLQAGVVTTGHGGDAQGDLIAGFADVIGTAFADRIEVADKTALPFGQSDNRLYGGGGRDRIAGGGGDDLIFGGTASDNLLGEAGNDSLAGNGGKDRLSGGVGSDVLSGGGGPDSFVFQTTSDSEADNADVITDFSSLEQDKIDLQAMDANWRMAGNQAFHLITGDFTGYPGELRFQLQDADLLVSGDASGDGQADFVIVVQNCQQVVAEDFVL